MYALKYDCVADPVVTLKPSSVQLVAGVAPRVTASTERPGSVAAPSVQYRKPTRAPAGTADRSAVRSTQLPSVLPVMPWPKFWPLGSVVVDRFVATGVKVAPPSVEYTT